MRDDTGKKLTRLLSNEDKQMLTRHWVRGVIAGELLLVLRKAIGGAALLGILPCVEVDPDHLTLEDLQTHLNRLSADKDVQAEPDILKAVHQLVKAVEAARAEDVRLGQIRRFIQQSAANLSVWVRLPSEIEMQMEDYPEEVRGWLINSLQDSVKAHLAHAQHLDIARRLPRRQEMKMESLQSPPIPPIDISKGVH